MLVDLVLEVGAVVPKELVADPTSTPQPPEASQVPTVDKDKGQLSFTWRRRRCLRLNRRRSS